METANTARNTRLQKLGGSDFEIADGQEDIRGWKVRDANNEKVGKVSELIFDFESRKVRYLVVDIKEPVAEEHREVLVPIGIAELAADEDEVLLPGVSMAQLASLPEFVEDRFDTAHEASVHNVFGGLGAGATTTAFPEFYNHDHFNDQHLYRHRNREIHPGNQASLPDETPVTNLPQDGGYIKLRNNYPDATRSAAELNPDNTTPIDNEEVPGPDDGHPGAFPKI